MQVPLAQRSVHWDVKCIYLFLPGRRLLALHGIFREHGAESTIKRLQQQVDAVHAAAISCPLELHIQAIATEQLRAGAQKFGSAPRFLQI